MTAQQVDVERHVDRLEPDLPERFTHDLLAGLFVAQGCRGLDEPREHVLHEGRLRGDRCGDLGSRKIGRSLSRTAHAGERTSVRTPFPAVRSASQNIRLG